MKKFVLNTWMLANCLHPVMYILMFIIPDFFSPGDVNDVYPVAMIFLMVTGGSIFAAVVSLPCLWISWCLTPAIIRSAKTLLTRFYMYLISGVTMVAVYVIALWLILDYSDPRVIAVFIPAFAATVAAICIRFKEFVKLVVEHDEHEELKLN